MNFLDLAKNKQSVHQYVNQPVEREKIEFCLGAARFAPSGSSGPSWEFIAIDDKEVKDAVAEKNFF